jgi:Tfp pilus assembly protein PilF
MKMIAVVAACAALFLPSTSTAQDSTRVNSLLVASALRDSAKFADAADTLRALLAREPANGDAARMLAQTLYWMKDTARARAQYETAIAAHPEDYTLKLDYGQMLVETRNNGRATQILEPLVQDTLSRGRATRLLGTMSYWAGDLTKAARCFRLALAADSLNAVASRQLHEIRTIAAPWISVQSSGLHDDQPLNRFGAHADGGWFINPMNAVSASINANHFSSEDSLTANIISGELAYLAHMPRAELTIGFGVAQKMRSGRSFTIPILRANGRFILPNRFVAGIASATEPYVATLSSFDVESRVSRISGTLTRTGTTGFLGETSFMAERFQDDNTVRSAYAWALAPVVKSTKAALHAGYSFAWQDSPVNNFVLLFPQQAVPATSPSFNFAGHYSPYYTPANLVAHTAIASLTVKPSPKTTLSANGGYAFHATEDAPAFTASSSNPVAPFRQLIEREIHPWNVAARLESAISGASSLTAAVEHMKTAFYSATSASVGMKWKFLPRPPG